LPPVIALLLCSGFVVFLIKLDRKQFPEASLALWIPSLWMFYISSKPLATWLRSSAPTQESSPVDRTFLIALICIALLVLVRRNFDWGSALRENRWLVLVIAVMFISIFWSDIPDTSFVRWVREFQAVIMGFLILSEPSPRRAMECVLRRTIYVLIPFSVLLIKYFPVYGRIYNSWSGEEQWVGVTLQKNGLGRLCLIAAIYILWSLIRRLQGRNGRVWKSQTILELSLLGMAAFLMKGPGRNYSATALGALALALLFYGILLLNEKRGKFMKAGTLITVVALVMALGIATFLTNGSLVGSIAPVMGRNSTLTDRVDIWKSLLPAAMQRPLLGHGFGGFWNLKNKKIFLVGESHNGYLDEFIDLGIVGLFLMCFFYLFSSRKAVGLLTRDYDWGTFWICLLLAVVVHNITETSINTFTTQLTGTILLLTVSSSLLKGSASDSKEESRPSRPRRD
jgi:exopolysaccharide production protein ExoQ